MKYQNKDKIVLSYTGNDTHTQLVKEVILEAIDILDKSGEEGIMHSIDKCKKFLKENFDIEE